MAFTSKYKQQEYKRLQDLLSAEALADYKNELLQLYEQGWEKIIGHGDYSKWSSGLDVLPEVDVAYPNLRDVVSIGDASSCAILNEDIEASLKKLHPWRKGPFDLFGVHIDTEWRSDLKWNRVVPHIASLKDKRVLDIGCGSGYHLWRMMGEEAELALGIDPTPLFSLHFAVIKRYLPQTHAFLIPTGIDEMPSDMAMFDTVFSMGVLYHRREPLEHLLKIKGLLKEGGELVLETLVIDGDENTCLIPKGRYAKMRNVWFIPSVAMLTIWLKRLGFKDVRCVDLNITSVEEQRSTDWMTFESLNDFLDPYDKRKTIEGYPAPQRAVMLATR